MIGALASLAVAAAGADPSAVLGLWRSPEDGGALVRIEACGAAVCGRIVTSPRLQAVPDQTDVRNRNPTLRSRRLADLLILKASPKAAGRWGDGWLYDPEKGGVYTGTMELTPDGRLRLTGCIVAPFCRTQVWTRARALTAAEPAATGARTAIDNR
ncbi:DUF2147 domain-containing protein [Phenylobacterium montanum]|uniref:DUF2147 domain-containing protein n=1 Tax=Phenylobacterium montanum TaxID=2823693 RepID=A0A975IWN9_9CAUL|nr:DUF2147 domain-containing protein [Caulobacter sp. S6]QUD89789.1 DUF2147 domain-containing protein [Caulobacter sp. S6]